MHDIKMHTKAREESQWIGDMPGYTGHLVKATARGRNMLQQLGLVCPVALGVMISSARPGKGLVSNSLESSQIPAPVEGGVDSIWDDTPCRPEL